MSHDGALNGHSSEIDLLTERGLGVIALANSDDIEDIRFLSDLCSLALHELQSAYPVDTVEPGEPLKAAAAQLVSVLNAPSSASRGQLFSTSALKTAHPGELAAWLEGLHAGMGQCYIAQYQRPIGTTSADILLSCERGSLSGHLEASPIAPYRIQSLILQPSLASSATDR